jgi:DNA-binding PadR family transcriptional regulator
MARAPINLTRLVVLWLLSEGPLHGYRIKRILDDEALGFWFRVEPASIYSVLRTLVKGGQVKVVAVERDGHRPERTRYAITREGRAHLTELLERAWREIPTTADPIQMALAARSEVTESQIENLLQERIDALIRRQGELEQARRSAPEAEMVDRLVVLTDAELRWAKSLLSKGVEK